MADMPNHPSNEDLTDDVLASVDGDVSFGEESEEDAPRRAASAEFIVRTEVGSDVALRDAMDPANQSLTEALRLSYRILQFVMVALVLFFLTSGFTRVGENESGVRTQFGQIVGDGAAAALSPGPRFNWPYPIGEFILFDIQNRTVSVTESYEVAGRGMVTRDVFWPGMRAGQSFAQAVEAATVNDRLQPGRDGHLVTRDSGIAHMRLSASYQIEDPVRFLETIPGKGAGTEADQLVQFAVQRAAIHVAARSGLQQITDLDEVTRADLHSLTQSLLDDINTGINIASVSVPETTAPLAIRRTLDELQEAMNSAEEVIVQAGREATQVLTRTAGERHSELIAMIDRYENALELNDQAAAEAILAELNEVFEEGGVAGEIANVISRAKSYRDQVEQTLGAEARRFESLLAIYREHPRLVVRQLWWSTRSSVLASSDAEVFYVPHGMGNMALSILGSERIQEIRRQRRLRTEDMQAQIAAVRAGGDVHTSGLQRARDVNLDGPGRQLDIAPTGEVVGQRR